MQSPFFKENIMNKLTDFLNKYHTVIFDLDGVITSEQAYWTAAALTVWELLRKRENIDPAWVMEHQKEIRDDIFCSDRLIAILKAKGVNSNWDLAYVTFALWSVYRTADEVLLAAEQFSDNILSEYDRVAALLKKEFPECDPVRNGALWCTVQSCFQEWYLGDTVFMETYGHAPEHPGKAGLCHKEEPLIRKDKLLEIFRLLKQSGKTLCTGTGRPYLEMKLPLQSFGIWEDFSPQSVICYRDVQKAERKFHKNLTKPHPFMFLKAYYGKDYPEEQLLNHEKRYPDALVVGDAGADVLAAKAAGMDFCAVLTGVSGKAARGYFEETGADYILDSLENFLED